MSRGKQNIFLLDLDKIFSFEGYKKVFEQRTMNCSDQGYQYLESKLCLTIY